MVSAQKPSSTGQAGSRAGVGGRLSRMDVFICNIPAHLPPLGQETWLTLGWPQGGQATGASYSIGHLLMMREQKARRAFPCRGRARAQVWRWDVCV